MVITAIAGATAADQPTAARAETTLYDTELAWIDRDADDRVRTFRQALRQVLVKITGLRRLADAAEFESLVENAPGIVQRYQLHPATERSGESAAQGPYLWVRFDEAAVDRLVQAAGLPMWGRIRPSVLVWVAIERTGKLQIIGSQRTGDIVEIFQRVAASRGVPFVLPLLDLEDRMQIPATGFQEWGDDRIRAVSERYRPGSILVGHVAPLSSGSPLVQNPPSGVPRDAVEPPRAGALWVAQWSLRFSGPVRRWQTEGDTLDLVVDEGVHEMVDILAEHYTNAALEEKPSVIAVSVNDVHDFVGYIRVLQYLESLDVVEAVDVLMVAPGRLLLELKLRTSAAGLRELIAFGATLTEDPEVDPYETFALRLLP